MQNKPQPTLQFRFMAADEAEDVALLIAAVEQVRRGCVYDQDAFHSCWFTMERMYHENGAQVVLAIDPPTQRMVGMIGWSYDDERNVHLRHLYAQESDRRIGSALVRRMIGFIDTAAEIVTLSRPEAQKFYLKMGFEPDRRRSVEHFVLSSHRAEQWRLCAPNMKCVFPPSF